MTQLKNTQQQQFLSPIPLEDLGNFIRNCIKEELENKVPQTPPSEELITSTETARILGVSKVTLHTWKLEGRIKYYRIGTRIRFKKAEVMEALQNPNNRGGKNA